MNYIKLLHAVWKLDKSKLFKIKTLTDFVSSKD